MEFDLWRHWQALAALAMASAHAPESGSARATDGFAPLMDAAQRFASAAGSFFDGGSTGSTNAAQAFGNFLRDQFTDLYPLPWLKGFAAPSAAAASAPLEAPALGLTREHQERAQRTAEAWQRLVEAQRRLQRLWSDTLREAAAAFVSRLTPQAPSSSAESLNRLYDAWIDCAEEAYARMAHSEPFSDALAECVNASSDWRRETSATIEQWAKLLDLPTRSEINTLALRLRAAEGELASMRAQLEAAAPHSREHGAARADGQPAESRPRADRRSRADQPARQDRQTRTVAPKTRRRARRGKARP
ncbi:MAG TPA: poly(R)-hydroxyalkanoic acid synthase subunit PhaE [Steroidobacteraceae bacterium]|nr:poly(R)-hydroxyalkanoic acid synthase subunit PhaE [Steroidobacteraceae bacterium]